MEGLKTEFFDERNHTINEEKTNPNELELDEKSEQEIMDLVGGLASTNIIVIKNVYPLWSNEQFFQLFSSCGEVVNFTRAWKPNSGRYAPYAFVTFRFPQEATFAKLMLDKCYLPDVPKCFPRMTVSYWENRPTRNPVNIFFTNLPREYTLTHLYDLCRPYEPHNEGRLFKRRKTLGLLFAFLILNRLKEPFVN